MKCFRMIMASLLVLAFTQLSAQEKTENFSVAGVCGMCEKKIETAAKAAGASLADWDRSSKQLTVKYNEKSTSSLKIQQAIARAGYDTPEVKATDEAYSQLHECCKYERKAQGPNAGSDEPKAKKAKHQCDMANCKGDHKDMDCSKDAAGGKSCCKKS